MAADLEELVVADAAALRAWLVEHAATSPGVWLVLTRKGGTTTTLTWQEAVDEGLCFGWIDGQGRKRDEQTSSSASPHAVPAACGLSATWSTWPGSRRPAA